MRKWRIERIQSSIGSRIQRLESDRTRMMSQASEVENTVTSWRNPILGGASFAAPLILALYSTDLSKGIVPPILIIDIALALGAFIAFTIIRGIIHKPILSMDSAFFTAIDKLNLFRRFFNSETYFLDKFNDLRLASFYNYAEFAQIAAQFGLKESLEKMRKNYFFKSMRKDLDDHLREVNEAQDFGKAIYESEKSAWKKSGIDMKLLRYIHEDFFKYLKYRIDDTTGEITKRLEKDDGSSVSKH
jgi:hypothetical protein